MDTPNRHTPWMKTTLEESMMEDRKILKNHIHAHTFHKPNLKLLNCFFIIYMDGHGHACVRARTHTHTVPHQ